MPVGVALAWIVALAPGPFAHPNSISTSRLVVDGARATLTLRIQILSLVEVMPEVDLDGDGFVMADEVEQFPAELEAYVRRHYRARAGGKEPLEWRLAGIEVDPTPGDWPGGLPWIELELAAERPRAIESLALEVDLFLEAGPFHRDLATIRWSDAAPVERVFLAGDPPFVARPLRHPRLRALGTGAAAAAGALAAWPGPLLLALALALGAARRRALPALAAAAAVGLAAPIALAPAAGALLPERTAALLAALSIAFVATENLLLRRERALWIEGLAFGAVHGSAAAAALAASLWGPREAGAHVLGYGLATVLPAALLALALLPLASRGWRRGAEGALSPGRVRALLSVGIALLGLARFARSALGG